MTIYVITKNGAQFSGTEAWRHREDAERRMNDLAQHLNAEFEETEDGGWIDCLSESIYMSTVVVQ